MRLSLPSLRRLALLGLLTLCVSSCLDFDLTGILSCGETAPVASLTLSVPRTTLAVGESSSITSTAKDRKGNDVTWCNAEPTQWISSDPAVEVDGSGFIAGVVARAEGVAVIEATTNGVSARLTLQVRAP